MTVTKKMQVSWTCYIKTHSQILKKWLKNCGHESILLRHNLIKISRYDCCVTAVISPSSLPLCHTPLSHQSNSPF